MCAWACVDARVEGEADGVSALRAIGRFLAALFQSPAARHAESVAVFMERGFSAAEAEMAAHELWRSCRLGLPTPAWIISRLEETGTA